MKRISACLLCLIAASLSFAQEAVVRAPALALSGLGAAPAALSGLAPLSPPATIAAPPAIFSPVPVPGALPAVASPAASAAVPEVRAAPQAKRAAAPAAGVPVQSSPVVAPESAREDAARAFEGQAERAAAPVDAAPSLASPALGSSLKRVKKDQTAIYLDFRREVRAAGSLNVPMPVFAGSLDYIRSNLKKMRKDIVQNKRKLLVSRKELLAFVDELIAEASELQSLGIPYERFVNYSFLFTVAATHRLAVAPQTEFLLEYAPFLELKTARRALRERQSIVPLSSDGLYFPTPAALDVEDFIAVRGTPLYFLGLTAEIQRADGRDMRPVEFFRHDLTHGLQMERTDNDQISILKFQPKTPTTMTARPESFFIEKRMRWDEFRSAVARIRDPHVRRAAMIDLFRLVHELPFSSLRGLPAVIATSGILLFPKNTAREITAGYWGDKKQLGPDPLKSLETAWPRLQKISRRFIDRIP